MVPILLLLMQSPSIQDDMFLRRGHDQTMNILHGNIILGNKEREEVYGCACPTGLNRAYTANHVLEHGITHAIIMGSAGSQKVYPIKVIWANEKDDIALIEIGSEGEDLATFPVFFDRAKRPPLPGSPTIAMFTIPPFVQVPSMGTAYGYIENAFWISNQVSNGSSGSCVLDEDGNAIGIAQGVWTWGPGLTGAPIFQATRIGLITRDIKDLDGREP